jgi:glycosyltransferase involved in cell wall biosynthesis
MKTTVVIPAFNEEKRLPSTLRSLREKIKNGDMEPLKIMEVIVVDDGSLDGTIRVARAEGSGLPGFRVVENGRNRGKGHSLRKGLEHANQPWVLLADADESTPWTEAAKFGHRCRDAPAPSVLIASRDTHGSQILAHQSFLRESLGRSFNIFVRVITGLPFRDTQCGFKLVQKTAVLGFLPELSVDGFAWDVELLLYARAAGVTTVEVPVIWKHEEDSRIKLFRDGIGMVVNVIRVRLRLLGSSLQGARRKKERKTARSTE